MSPLLDKIRREIEFSGAITFARFMELALYCPVYGYYEKEGDTIGRRGDFYTSVSVGNLFGKMLAWQFAAWLAPLVAAASDPAAELHLVEAGAHHGALAADILTWLQAARPELLARVEYWLVEPSERRRQIQQKALAGFAPRVKWAVQLEHVAGGTVRGVIFSNELLDAFPVHRFAWDARRREWFEWGVACADDRLVWTRLKTPSFEPPHLPAAFHALEELIPDGFIREVSPAAANWWRTAAGRLQAGRLLTFDYGFADDQWLAPERNHGTLRAYRRHLPSDDLLSDVGDQDLTAHVDFGALESAGESAGLTTETLATQEQFLTRVAERLWSKPDTFEVWTPAHTRQFQTLTHPNHLGRAFRVLVQARA